MNDDKTARDYNIEGGSVLHLVRHHHACYTCLRVQAAPDVKDR